jgi:hypothetical protein
VDPAGQPALAFVLGVIFHIASGGAMGALYTLIFRRHTPLTGIAYMLGSWLIMMLVVFPLTGRGAWGLAADPAMPLSTFSLSMLYGVAVGAMAGRKVGSRGALSPMTRAPMGIQGEGEGHAGHH